MQHCGIAVPPNRTPLPPSSPPLRHPPTSAGRHSCARRSVTQQALSDAHPPSPVVAPFRTLIGRFVRYAICRTTINIVSMPGRSTRQEMPIFLL
jgi:hypothetical protein